MNKFSYNYNADIQPEDIHNDIYSKLKIYAINITYNIANNDLEIIFDFKLNSGQSNILDNIIRSHPKKKLKEIINFYKINN
jgi:hypothetical protein